MRGSVSWQVTEVFKTINSLGTSKHEAKAVARAEGAKTWEQMGQAIGIHSHSTYDDYTRVARDAFEFSREQYGVRDITRLEGHMVQSYLVDKIEAGGRAGRGIERATYNSYAAAAHKLELALNRYSDQQNLGRSFDFGLREVGKFAAQALGDKCTDSRAYKDVDRLVDSLAGKYALMGAILRETGFRISEGSNIKADQLKGIKADPYDHRMKHWISAIGKGGKKYERPVSAQTYKALERIIATDGRWRCNQGNFREKLQAAAAASNQHYEGPHGIRWSVAQERHAELQKLGYSYESSLKIVSSELNHIRGDITKHYLH